MKYHMKTKLMTLPTKMLFTKNIMYKNLLNQMEFKLYMLLILALLIIYLNMENVIFTMRQLIFEIRFIFI